MALLCFGIAAVGAFSAVMRNIFSCRTSQYIGKELRGDIYRKKYKHFPFEKYRPFATILHYYAHYE